MVWRCISHDCKLDLVTIQGNLTGDQYIRDVLQPVVVPLFDNHPLATRPVHMDDNARPHRSRACSNRLPPKRSRDFCSLASHEPGIESHRGAYLGHVRPSYIGSGTTFAKHFVSWKQHCIGNGSSYHNRTSDVSLEGWDAGLRPSSKHVGVTPGTELWTIDVVKWFIVDVLKVKWQSYRAFWAWFLWFLTANVMS